MQVVTSNSNPFALFMTPEAVFAELEKSECLRALARRICTPLDDREAKQGRRDVRTLGEVDRNGDAAIRFAAGQTAS